MRKRTFIVASALAAWVVALVPSTVFAHGFGDRYDLPVPLGLYMTGAGIAVLLSFVVIGVFARGQAGGSYPRRNLLRSSLGRAIAHPVLLGIVRALSALVFVVFLAAGLFGSQEANENLAPTMVWVMFWVGVAYASAVFGDVWALINPWKIIFGYAEALVRRAGGGELSRFEPYPEGLGAWPAVSLFLVFAWVEIVFPGSGVPLNIAALTLLYSVVTFTGMWWFGRDVWLQNGEPFSIVFRFFATLSPTETRVKSVEDSVNDYALYSGAAPEHREFNLRPWGVGLVSVPPLGLSHAALLVLMLATVSFDGFVETGPWTRFLLDTYSTFDFLGARVFEMMTTIALLVVPLVFLGVFAITAWAMVRMTNTTFSVTDMVRTFALSLVPIAFAYHVAHFFSFLAIQGQRMFYLVSDPFGLGWDIFGTADYTIDISVVNARIAWFASVIAIVVGHIVAVYVAHVYATKTFPSTRDAVRSQYPMLVLMVAYTMVSLWIVAQPIVEL